MVLKISSLEEKVVSNWILSVNKAKLLKQEALSLSNSKVNDKILLLEESISYYLKSISQGNYSFKNLSFISDNFSLLYNLSGEAIGGVRYLLNSISYAIQSRELGNTHHANNTLIANNTSKLVNLISRNQIDIMAFKGYYLMNSGDSDFEIIKKFLEINDEKSKNKYLIEMCDLSINTFLFMKDKKENDGGDVKGYINHIGRLKVTKGRTEKNIYAVLDGIEDLESIIENINVAGEISQYINLRNLYSETAEAYTIAGRLSSQNINEILNYYINSVKYYRSALKEGKSEIDILGRLGFSYLKIGGLLNDDSNLSLSRYDVIDLFGKHHNLDSLRLKKKIFETALTLSEKAKFSYNDHSKEMNSKIGDALIELAKISFLEDNIDETFDYINRANHMLMESVNQHFSYGSILRSELTDFVKTIDINMLNERNKFIYDNTLNYSWSDTISFLFKLQHQGKVTLSKLAKGTSRVYRINDHNYPSNFSVIIKEYDSKDEAVNDFVIHKNIFDSLKGTGIRFSRPINVIEYDNKHYFIIKRNKASDLEEQIKYMDDEDKLGYIHKFVKLLANFHTNLTTNLSNQDFNLYLFNKPYLSIWKINYLHNFIARFTTGRDNISTKLSSIVELGDREEFNRLEMPAIFNRVPYNQFSFDFFVSYNKFINENRGGNTKDYVLHSDMYPTNILDDGTIIDPKPLRLGNPLFDLSHFIESPEFDVYEINQYKDWLIDDYLNVLTDDKQEAEELKQSYDFINLHNSLCLFGAFYNQGNLDHTRYYLEKSHDLIKSKSEELYDVFFNYIYHTGVGLFRRTLMDKNPEKYEGLDNAKKQHLNIGVDFDNVIADTTQIKIKRFKEVLGVHVEPQDCSKEAIAKKGVSNEQYSMVVNNLLADDSSLNMGEVKNSKYVIDDLVQQGHTVYIITSRYGDQTEIARKWLRLRGYSNVEVINTDEKPKDIVCKEKNIDIIIDDNYLKLKQIHVLDIKKVLYRTLSNDGSTGEMREGIVSVNNWNSIYSIVNELLVATR